MKSAGGKKTPPRMTATRRKRVQPAVRFDAVARAPAAASEAAPAAAAPSVAPDAAGAAAAPSRTRDGHPPRVWPD
jgi:hypothetical protein